MVTAINAKGHKQIFSDQSWALLKNKGTWQELPSQQVQNTINTKATKLQTGEKLDQPKEQKITNVLQNDGENANGTIEQKIQDTVKPKKSKVSEEKQKEFILSLDSLTRPATRDLIDKYNETAEVKIEYPKTGLNSGNEDLKELLAKALDYDIDAFVELSSK